MRYRTVTIAVLLVSLVATATAAGHPLAHRHALAVNLGAWSPTADVRVEAIPGTLTTSVGGDGLLGGVSYAYFLEEDIALSVSVNVHDVDLSTEIVPGRVSTHSAAVGCVLFGLQYYVPASTRAGSVRPYLGGGIGVYNGDQDDVVVGTIVAVSSRSAHAFGGRLGVGVDFGLGRHFLLGVATKYHLMTDFGQPIAGRRNYSGPEFSGSIGFVFGGDSN